MLSAPLIVICVKLNLTALDIAKQDHFDDVVHLMETLQPFDIT